MTAVSAKVKACKSVLFTEGIPDVEINILVGTSYRHLWFIGFIYVVTLQSDLDWKVTEVVILQPKATATQLITIVC